LSTGYKILLALAPYWSDPASNVRKAVKNKRKGERERVAQRAGKTTTKENA